MRPDPRPIIDQALAALPQTRFEPTLRALIAELFWKEQAEEVAFRALGAAKAELGQLREEVARRDARIVDLETRLDELDAPARVRTMSGGPHRVLEWETVEPGSTAAADDG